MRTSAASPSRISTRRSPARRPSWTFGLRHAVAGLETENVEKPSRGTTADWGTVSAGARPSSNSPRANMPALTAVSAGRST